MCWCVCVDLSLLFRPHHGTPPNLSRLQVSQRALIVVYTSILCNLPHSPRTPTTHSHTHTLQIARIMQRDRRREGGREKAACVDVEVAAGCQGDNEAKIEELPDAPE
jgi:hypothetical protein